MVDADGTNLIASHLDAVLQATKFSIPSPISRVASHDALIEGARTSAARIVGVTAPAGYGKSTLLAEWAAVERRRVAWISLDRFDDDPAALLTLIATAFAKQFPAASNVVGAMRGLGPMSLGRSAPLLATAFTEASAPFMLAIDDLHEVGSPACQDVLEVALAGVPAGSQAVLASRHEQAHFAKLRMRSVLHEIGARDLEVGVGEARRIFAGVGAEISDAHLVALVERTEGWAAGLRLAALVVRDGGGTSVTGDDRFVADYLYRECLRGLSPGDQRFLRRTAILDQLSAPACDAVLQASDSGDRLRHLERRGLFLTPLDHRRGWYRYHPLFREFLAAELGATERDASVALHRRAAAWFESNGFPSRAIEHLLACGDREAAAYLVAEQALPAYQEGRVAVVARWMRELGDDAIESFPPLAVLTAWTAVLTGRVGDAERWAAIVDRADYDIASDDDRAAFESARAMLRAAMCTEGPERALAEAEFAVASEPTWSPWRDQALHLEGSVRLLLGDRDAARRAFEEASSLAASLGNTDSVVLSEPELALLALEEHHWSEAERHIDVALRAIDAHHMDGYPTTALALAVGARVALHRGDRPAAERLLARGMRARVGCTRVLPFVAMRVRLQLAAAFLAIRERVTVMHVLRELDDLLARRPHVGVLADEIAAFRERAQQIPDAPGRPPLTPAELRVLPYLQTHLTLGEVARRLFISRNTVGSEVRSIYRKLGVTSRGEAVACATELGLLGE